MKNQSIKLPMAILICLNTMIGAGLFINPAQLTKIAGPYGFLAYPIAALIMLPTIICISALAKLHPVPGGLYVYSQKYLGDRIGFLAAWSFFLAKTVSPVLILHKIVSFFHARIPSLQQIPLLTLDYVALFFIILAIIGGMRIGGNAQYLFISLKTMPLLFVFFCSAQLFSPNLFVGFLPSIQEGLSVLPIAIFALTGFEVICGIGNFIENPEKNIQRAILIAFSIVVTIATCFQICFFGSLGNHLGTSTEPVLTLAQTALNNYPLLGNIINSCVFASMFGGVFTMFASTCWYVHRFGTEQHFPAGKILSLVNKHNVPWVGLMMQGVLAALLITITQEQVALQTMSVFALFACYLITNIATLRARYTNVLTLSKLIPLGALICSGYVGIICLHNIQKAGISFSFLGIFIAGIALELITYKAIHKA